VLSGARRLAALALAGGLALAGCGGSTSDDPAADPTSGDTSPASSGGGSSSSATESPTPTTDVEVPAGVTLTEPGAQLSYGDTARVPFEVTRPAEDGKGAKVTAGTVLAITVDSATKGRLDDLAGFALTEAQRKANYYYVRVRVKNIGTKRLGDVGVPLWGISGENTLLPPVRFNSAFATCPTEPLPLGFAPGARLRTCLVFLSADKGTLVGVSYRPTTRSTSIEWRGKVTSARSGTPGRRSGKGR
jgi:hypothetical protein